METLRNYLDSMFKRYPETPEAEHAKAELWQMMEDKYNELLADGKKENEAVGIVISEFGDLEEVAESLGIATMLQKVEEKAQNATATAGPASRNAGESEKSSVADPTPVLQFGTPVVDVTQASAALNGNADALNEAAAERSSFADEAAAQAFGTAGNAGGQAETAWQSTEQSTERGGAWWTWHNTFGGDGTEPEEGVFRFLTGVLSVFWPTVTCLYLCWSFLTFKWWLTWIIWPLAAILHSVLKRLIMGDVSANNGQTYKNRLIAAVLDSYWPCVVFVYFAFSFLTGAWAISWLIFVIAPFVRKILKNNAVTEEVA